MVVKRKNPNLQGKDLLDNIQDKLVVHSSSNNTNVIMQKIKEIYNGYHPLEFKGWVDLNRVELFNGLEGRQDTFFLRTNLTDQQEDSIMSDDNTEKEYEDYFRKSDRLYSLRPHQSTTGSDDKHIELRNQLVALCQKQGAISKLEGMYIESMCLNLSINDNISEVLYIENKYKIPAYTHFYNEESYPKSKHKVKSKQPLPF